MAKRKKEEASETEFPSVAASEFPSQVEPTKEEVVVTKEPLLSDSPSKLSPEARAKAEVENPDDALDALKRVLKGIKTGESLSDTEPLVARLVANQEARAKVINSLIMTHDYDRLMKYLEVRKNLDRVLTDHCANKTIKARDALAYYKLVTTEIDEVSARMKAHMVSDEEMMNMVNKFSVMTDMSEEALAEKFKGTSPAGRAMVMKTFYRLKKFAEKKDGHGKK